VKRVLTFRLVALLCGLIFQKLLLVLSSPGDEPGWPNLNMLFFWRGDFFHYIDGQLVLIYSQMYSSPWFWSIFLFILIHTRGNHSQEKLLNDYIDGEIIMNGEIDFRTSNDMFEYLEENTYQVNNTGASISTACSVSLLHRYCYNLPKDMYVRAVVFVNPLIPMLY
jgi:hypothetical protein